MATANQACDIGMIQAAGIARFGEDLLQAVIGVLKPVGKVKESQRDDSTRLGVVGFVNGAQSPPAELFDQLESIDLRFGRSRRTGCGHFCHITNPGWTETPTA